MFKCLLRGVERMIDKGKEIILAEIEYKKWLIDKGLEESKGLYNFVKHILIDPNGKNFVKAGGFVMFLGIGAGLSLIGYGVFKEII